MKNGPLGGLLMRGVPNFGLNYIFIIINMISNHFEWKWYLHGGDLYTYGM